MNEQFAVPLRQRNRPLLALSRTRCLPLDFLRRHPHATTPLVSLNPLPTHGPRSTKLTMLGTTRRIGTLSFSPPSQQPPTPNTHSQHPTLLFRLFIDSLHLFTSPNHNFPN